MEKWFIKNSKDYELSYEKYGLNKILYRILLNRGIKSDEELEKFLKPDLSNIHSPIFLKDMVKSANIIISHITKGSNIRIVGDYDVDGITSTYILYCGLKKIGAKVSYDIPNRVLDGYGINNKIIDRAKEDDISLIITCDNGIAAFEPVKYARNLGIDVIVTDHHEPAKVLIEGVLQEKLPDANGLIDPKVSDSKYPFKDICGACVAFKLISYLYLIKGKEEQEVYDDFLAYVALATVCDVMPLKDENRILIHYGLEALKNVQDVGLNALISACDIKKEDIDVYHIGFIIGPTLNACGRLKTAKEAVELLLEKDYNSAIEKAKEIRSINNQRQNYTNDGYIKAIKIIKEQELLKKYPILLIYVPNINESIVGIIAGRIKEKFYRPTIVLTDSNGIIKGSGRSIDEYNMFEEVNVFRDELEAFGGHKMACGLSIKKENFNNFNLNLNKNAKLTRDDLTKKIYIDYPLNFSQINMKLFQDLNKLKPFGTDNEKPLFGSRNLKITDIAIFGTNKNVIKLMLEDSGVFQNALLFKDSNEFLNDLKKAYGQEAVTGLLQKSNKNIKIDVIYSIDVNNFRGNSSIELRLKSYRVNGEKDDNRRFN